MAEIFTLEEITAQVTAYKAALIALATAQTVRLSTGGTDRLITRADLPEVRKTLEWLRTEQSRLETGTAAAAGRTYAKQAGGGRW